MNKYESVIIINPNVEEETIKSLIDRFSTLRYVVFEFDANPSLIAELERNYRIADEVIKFITVKK